MKKCLIVLAGVAFLAASANAATLRLYYSTRGPTSGTPQNEDITTPYTPPSEAAADINPGDMAVAGDQLAKIDLGPGGSPTVTLFVWAEMVGGGAQKWAGIGMDIKTVGDVKMTGFNFWNYTNGGYIRWDGTGIGSSSATLLNDIILAAVSQQGVNSSGNTTANAGADKQYINNGTTNRHVVIGSVTFMATAPSGFFGGMGWSYIGIGDAGIARDTGVEESIYLGHGDEGDGLTGESKNTYSTIAEASFMPEPASIVLLALAGLMLRRR
jgi:hypothetical protein